jgi:hypothetical protein
MGEISWRSTLNACLAAALLTVAGTLANAAQDTAPGELAGVRPNAGGDPDVITVRLGLLDIAGIDDKEQLFTIDAYVEIAWQDRRLAAETGTERTFSIDDVWTPRLAVVNDRGLDLLLPEVVTVDGQGNATLRQRLTGPLAVGLDLREFPFDSQRLSIEVVSYQYTTAELVFSDATGMVARNEEFSAGGWIFEPLASEFSTFRLAADGPGRSQVTFSVLAQRNAGYYVLTLALPMILILCLSWMVHWLPGDVVPARMGMSSASVFSLIAFGVSFRLTLPKIDYVTQADRFVIYSTLLVLLSLVVTVLAVRWVNAGRAEDANRASRVMRGVFPAAFALIVALMFVG